MDWLTMSLGFGGGGAVLWVLKKIPNDKICAVVEGGFEKLGVLMTAGLTKFWATKAIWNNVVGDALRGLIKGLRSDNKK